MRRRTRCAVLLGSVGSLLVLGSGAGCSKCGRDHPYVPYSIDEGGPKAVGSVDPAQLADGADAGAFVEQPAAIAPPNVAEWTLDGLKLVAPNEMVLALAAVKDLDGDGVKDAVALVRSLSTERTQLVLYKGTTGGTAPAIVIGDAPILTVDPSCAKNPSPPPPKLRLAIVGKRSALVEVSSGCPPQSAKDPARWLAVASIAPVPRLAFQLFITDPPSAPELTFEADGSDRDGDGLDDVTLRATLTGGAPPFEPGPKTSVVLRWFDRPAGMSRDPDEPDATLRSLATGAVARAGRAKDAPSVPVQVRQIRALYAALCAEGGAPRITRAQGSGTVSCGPSRGLEEAGLAEVRAYATTGDVLRAVAAFDRAQRPPATKTPARTTEAQGWITQAAPVAGTPSTMRAVSAVPQIDRGKAPAWGALAFDPSGKLLVRTLAGVVRVDPLQGDEKDATDVATWKMHVASPDGAMRWIETYSACDGVALHATFAPTGDADPKDLALPIAPAFSGRCTTAKGESVLAIPIAWGPGGLEAIVAGEPVLFSADLARASALASLLEQPGPQGSPRSPNGKALAVPTSLGIVARVAGAKTRLLRAKELEGGYGDLRDCTVNDDGTRVGCVRGGRAFVGIWE
jgi:hypothetical protein